jgi:hypothetical protein
MEMVCFNGWRNTVRLSNKEIELLITADVGPRVVRFGFIRGKNLFAEIQGQQGGTGEREWMIRGGHRLWIAPEKKPDTYELDNVPVEHKFSKAGVKFQQEPGPVTNVAKTLTVSVPDRQNRTTVEHTLTNRSRKNVTLSPWALSVMAPGGMAVIPLPDKVPHTSRLTHNQEWSIWSYMDFTDPRWTFGSRYVILRQDRRRGPTKLGIAHREGWVAYQLGEFLFVKAFKFTEGASYPDGGVNFETFSNEQMLELESLGPLVTLKPGASVRHIEVWQLFRGLPRCYGEADVDRYILPLIRGG